MKVNAAATYGQNMSPVWVYFTKLYRRFRQRDEPGQERHASCVAETARSAFRTPTTNGTKALIRHLHKASYILYTQGDLPELHSTDVAVLGG